MDDYKEMIFRCVREAIESGRWGDLTKFSAEFTAYWIGEELPPSAFEPLLAVLEWPEIHACPYSLGYFRIFTVFWNGFTPEQYARVGEALCKCLDKLVDLMARYCLMEHLLMHPASHSRLEYARRFAASPDPDTRRWLGAVINGAIAVGDISQEDRQQFRPVLEALLHDPSQEVRDSALDVMQRLENKM